MSLKIRDCAYGQSSERYRSEQINRSLNFRLASAPEDESDPKNQSFDNLNETSKLTDKKIAVILGYYNGDKHVNEQLQSILGQSYQSFHIFISDDQSKHPFAVDSLCIDDEQLSKLSVGIRTQNVGFTNNFLYALANVGDGFEYFAFSDQDDIWCFDKLQRAIDALKNFSNETPALYCARTEIADAQCENTFGLSPLFLKPPSFANALVQSIGGGNTMVFNKAAKELIVSTIPAASPVSHDWWCYQIVSGAGGYVVYDPKPCLKYRQHADNQVGANSSWHARFVRTRGLFQGRFRRWNDINMKALSDHSHLLTDSSNQVLNEVMEARQSSLIKRLYLFKKSGIYRQNLLGNLGLFLGILLNKI